MTGKARKEKGLYWDRAWYLVEGCRHVDRSCDRCWAADFAKRFGRQKEFLGPGGRWNNTVRFRRDKLDIPGEGLGKTWAVWNDLFHPGVVEADIVSAFSVMRELPCETFLVLTKRPIRLRRFIASCGDMIGSNVWLGTSICGTSEVESFYRLKCLLETEKGKWKWLLSVEPMLSPVNLGHFEKAKVIDLVICGCESGGLRRKIATKHLDDLIMQCGVLELKLFIKQWEFDKGVIKPEKFPGEYQKYTQLPF